MSVLVTGGCGFIGANFILDFAGPEKVLNIDLLTYAGNVENLRGLSGDSHRLIVGDIGDAELVASVFESERPRAVVHFAAESHVDRSVLGPGAFVRTNVLGTFVLLEEARKHHASLRGAERDAFRFLMVSTDEVYGSLGPDDPPFTEKSPYRPNSPYSASKAGADHLGRAYFKTYGLPVMISNCSNNYGPFQYPEKFIPLTILNSLALKPLPLYGDGRQIRDWLHVADHARALKLILREGKPGETYNIGGNGEMENIEVARAVTGLLDAKRPRKDGGSHGDLIAFAKDRPGHDRRYAVDSSKIERELGFRRHKNFRAGLEETVDWYLANPEWVESVKTREYRDWMRTQYGDDDGKSPA
ncbi:MAG: dTDP-glucose 4,6-dehydratase [Deltaproteobacteria bacterium]|jgi:dTDP-glucose 4,6-dehydratase|nr:dTDP-glucose 4,6-dehydratase [Deltaproteobacteria bacterium]